MNDKMSVQFLPLGIYFKNMQKLENRYTFQYWIGRSYYQKI